MRIAGSGALVFVLFFIGCGQSDDQELQLNSLSAEFDPTPFWPEEKPGDASLSSRHILYPYFQAAKAKHLPLNYFRDLIADGARLKIRYADWPRYQPGWTGATLYHPMIGKNFSEWKRMDWASFYNELFHAWWGQVFQKEARFATDRRSLLTRERKQHYRKAHPRDPLLAQEEAYSESIATLMIYLYPQYNPDGPEGRYYALSFYTYNRGRTVSPVSHSEQPGYTPEAENTYPNAAEYRVFFRQLTDHEPPEGFLL